MENANVTIIPTITGDDLPEAGVKAGTTVYLAWDQSARRLFVVQWDRVRWFCSCGRNGCTHRLAVNTYVFEQSISTRK